VEPFRCTSSFFSFPSTMCSSTYIASYSKQGKSHDNVSSRMWPSTASSMRPKSKVRSALFNLNCRRHGSMSSAMHDMCVVPSGGAVSSA
jgi:hypothetical protein